MRNHHFSLIEYKDKKVLVTGHTGFKGGWLCHALTLVGAHVIGFSLPQERESSSLPWVFDETLVSYGGDVGDFSQLLQVFTKEQPEFVFHLAAQALVLPSYEDPVGTYQSNVMGTVHICQCVNLTESVKSFVNITTDKVYQNNEWEWGYRETDVLDGYDPYSNSKSCAELVTASFIRSFLKEKEVPTSTLRAGNVIGGGDRSESRILPDCVRASQKKQPVKIRNPKSVRPYQHVIEPIYAYLMVGMAQYKDKSLASSYNIGPDVSDCLSTEEMVRYFVQSWGDEASYEIQGGVQAHEANFLRLDCAKLKKVFDWKPVWSVEHAVKKTVEWEKAFQLEGDSSKITKKQIEEYILNAEKGVEIV